MHKAHRIRLPIVLAAAVALTLTMAWSTSHARPYLGYAWDVSDIKHKAGALSGEPDTPGIAPQGGNGTKSLSRTGGSDHQATWTRGTWVMLVWMRMIQR